MSSQLKLEIKKLVVHAPQVFISFLVGFYLIIEIVVAYQNALERLFEPFLGSLSLAFGPSNVFFLTGPGIYHHFVRGTSEDGEAKWISLVQDIDVFFTFGSLVILGGFAAVRRFCIAKGS